MRSFSEQNEQLCQKIESMEADRCEMTQKLNQLNYENAELCEKLEENMKYVDSNELKKLQDEAYESKRKLADVIAQLEDVEKKHQEKTDAHEKSLQVIKKACEHIEDLELHVEQLKSSQPNSLSSTESAKNVRLIIAWLMNDQTVKIKFLWSSRVFKFKFHKKIKFNRLIDLTIILIIF